MPISSTEKSFHPDLSEASTGLRRRMGAIIESVCGGTPRAQDITDHFGIHRKLGWQIWNVVYDDNHLSVVRHLPNAKGLKVWTDAASAKGVDAALLTKLDEALAIFNKSSKVHADDRELLEMLVDGHAPSLDLDSAERWRKLSFTGNAFTFGVRARVAFTCAIVFPTKTPDAPAGVLDMVRVQGLAGFIRTRPGVRWPFSQLLFRDGIRASEKVLTMPPNRSPLVESGAFARTGVPVIPEYCSDPLPAIHRIRRDENIVEDELQPADVGLTAAADVVTGEIIREALKLSLNEEVTFGTGVRTPCETFISDLLLHHSLFPRWKKELIVFGEVMRQFSRDDRDRIPVPERIQELGRANEGFATADVPRHAQLMADVFTHANLNPADFDVLRVRMKYPPLPVSVTIRRSQPAS